jgi:modulator of FtsH protease
VETVTAGDWAAFYTAQLGAAAVLGGLVFVGLSLNLKKILSYAWLPARALLELMVLMAILIISSFMLMPGQSLTALGIEIAAVGVLLFFFGSGIVGGALLLFGMESGFYWIAAGVIVSFIKAVTDAWVLLVEINR